MKLENYEKCTAIVLQIREYQSKLNYLGASGKFSRVSIGECGGRDFLIIVDAKDVPNDIYEETQRYLETIKSHYQSNIDNLKKELEQL